MRYTPEQDTVKSASTESSLGLEQTKEDPPPGFHWVGTKPILIYDIKNAIVKASRPVPYQKLNALSSQEYNTRVFDLSIIELRRHQQHVCWLKIYEP